MSGPHDPPSDRFTYWLVRISHGGEVLAPSPLHSQVQFIDARDLAEFILFMAGNRQAGIFNTAGPNYQLTIEDFLQECIRVTKTKPTLTWVSEEFIVEKQIDPPVWVPIEWAGINQVNCQKAIDAGLSFRPLAETIRDTLTWHNTHTADYEFKSGLKPKREKELLQTWHLQKNNK